jgi:pyridoxine 5-phosphate synthase
MTKLSVNINKIATLRNARGGDNPNLIQVAKDCERFGAQGITVHPRPDQRHISYQDVYDLKQTVTTEFNIEGYPSARFMELVLDVKPEQVTLVPDPPEAITSDNGWDTVNDAEELIPITTKLKAAGIRVSVFANPDINIIEGAKNCGVDRVELYTGPFADNFKVNKEKAVSDYLLAGNKAKELGIGLNAGHDLDLTNLAFLKATIPHMDEVSIGHALVCDALYYGLENTIQLYLRQLK